MKMVIKTKKTVLKYVPADGTPLPVKSGNLRPGGSSEMNEG